ncbi:hypothetical protein GQ457_06G017510 [Hibiscus cannabinus]
MLKGMHCYSFSLESTTSKSVRFPSIPFPSVYSLRMGHKIKKINERLETVAADFKRFNLGAQIQTPQNRPYVVQSHRDTHSFMTFKVLGRDRDRENIIDLLVQPRGVENIPVIPIVGIGGLGKTTLAQFVYNDERITRCFPLKIWVCVSEFFDVGRLLCEIIYCINRERCDGLPVNALLTLLQSLIKGKKFLLVPDDVWNEDRVKWNELKEILMKLDDLHQSKIIVTTRSLVVASIMGTNSPYELGALNHQDSLSLLLKCAFNQGDEGRYPKLLEIADEIVKKCKGVPLAVRTLGSLLAGKTNPRDWKQIRDNDIWKLDQQDSGIIPVLKLSYNHLPSHLKRCLAYLSLFPKDAEYDTDYIIQFWMANGLLDSPKHVNERGEDIGLQYFMDLWSKGFVQDQTLSASDNVRHLAFADRNPLRTPQPFLKKLKGVRTLVVLHPPRDFRVMEKSFLSACISYFKYLRLLELQNCLLDALPNSICNLKHLRYLNLNSCKNLSRLPKSIHKLESLLTLRLFNVPNLQVPDKLQRLINLRFLEITTSSLQLWEIRPGNWSSLQYLGIDRCNKLKFMFEGMQHLSQIRGNYNSGLPKIQFTHGTPGDRKPKPPVKPQNFHIFQFTKFEGSASHLEFLQIDRCPNLEELPDWVQNLNSLQRLEISECPKLHSLPHGVERLTALRQLKIQQCPTLSDKVRPQTGEDWSKISHIHEVHIEDQKIINSR